MILYVEGIETGKSEGEPDLIRIDITGYSIPEIDDCIADITNIFGTMPHKLQYHYCNHDSNEGCKVIAI